MKTVYLDVLWINLLSGSIIPLLVGFVTKKVASPAVKSLCNALLSAVSAGLVVLTSGPVEVKVLIASFVTTFVASTGVYYGLWKPTGAADAVQNKTSNFGVGAKPEPESSDADHM